MKNTYQEQGDNYTLKINGIDTEWFGLPIGYKPPVSKETEVQEDEEDTLTMEQLLEEIAASDEERQLMQAILDEMEQDELFADEEECDCCCPDCGTPFEEEEPVYQIPFTEDELHKVFTLLSFVGGDKDCYDILARLEKVFPDEDRNCELLNSVVLDTEENEILDGRSLMDLAALRFK